MIITRIILSYNPWNMPVALVFLVPLSSDGSRIAIEAERSGALFVINLSERNRLMLLMMPPIYWEEIAVINLVAVHR